MLKKTLLIGLSALFLTLSLGDVYGASTEYTTLKEVDKNTFNEYKYKITEQYIDLKNRQAVLLKTDTAIAKEISRLAEIGFRYLPDDLINKNHLRDLQAAIERGIMYPENTTYFDQIAKAIENYLNNTTIQAIKGSIGVNPSSGNAPLNVTLRGDVADPTGTKLENYNYTWYVENGGKRAILSNKISFNYTFPQEGNYKIFLDVTSNHKNAGGYTDVLPFSSYADVQVKEKIASIVLKVNNTLLGNLDEIKFNPDEAKYGLLFDATSSTPTSGAKFTSTEWDFGNGVKRSYEGAPKIERVMYATEGTFAVKLTLRTNEGKTVEKKFYLIIHKPIATIKASAEEGFMGDKFTFSASSNGSRNNLTYKWTITDINNDIEVVGKNSSTFSYIFKEKGKYNVQLWVTEPSGDVDMDSKIIYINSRAPQAKFNYSIPDKNKPNTVYFDATSSFDADYSDDGKLTFNWDIDGQRVNLVSPNYNGSTGYYTFSSVGNHAVKLEVTDPDNMNGIKEDKVDIKSLLSLDFQIIPRVSQVGKIVTFTADSPRAEYYRWDFGDGLTDGGIPNTITHEYRKSGTYIVKLKVTDKDDNENTLERNIFIGNADEPYAFISVKNGSRDVAYRDGECHGQPAYVINRTAAFTFSAEDSVDVDGRKDSLTYNWLISDSDLGPSQSLTSNNGTSDTRLSFTKKFSELGCYKLKLSVGSEKNGKMKTSVQEAYVKVENLKPTLLSLNINVKDVNADPSIITITAVGAKDIDGSIQQYNWSYYTDSDPTAQEIKITTSNSVVYTLPKISDTYYFQTTMKDNNGAQVRVGDRDDINKYYITLMGDNANAPIVKLNVNKNSVYIKDEIIFTADAKNILGENLNNLATFSWDLDGDGFYEKETTTNTMTGSYNSSGEKNAKVRVKYKGFSNTHTTTINVANLLKPDFDYMSIGNNFIFFDNSLSNGAKYEWNMGDGQIVFATGSFTYVYKDNKPSHEVILRLTEGTKIQELPKKVVRNVKNELNSKNKPLYVYSNFEIVDTETGSVITLEEDTKVYFYLTSNNPNVKNYVADFDINVDSDLNGGNDDDEDNKNDDNYKTGEPILVALNKDKEQIVRLYVKDGDSNVIASKDIKILKKYVIVEPSLEPTPEVPEIIKSLFEKIKEIINTFPQETKLRSIDYINRLQAEWNDNKERISIIVDFQNFIEGENESLPSKSNLLELLDVLANNGDEIVDTKTTALNALKTMLPSSITCTNETQLEFTADLNNCYDLITAKLEAIYESSNIDENIVLGKAILSNIGNYADMTNEQKVNFKAILSTLVYGDVSGELEGGDETPSSSFFSGVLKIIGKIFMGLAIIVGVAVGLILLFFIYYKLSNKDSSLGFTDFILEKTKHSPKREIGSKVSEKVEDILGESIIPSQTKEAKKAEDIFSEIIAPIPKEEEEEKGFVNEVEPKADSGVPDWLKGSFSPELLQDIEGEGEKTEEESVNNNEESSLSSEAEMMEKPIENQEEVESGETEGETEIPDWLRGSFTKKKENNVETENGEKENIENEENNDELNLSDVEMPLVVDQDTQLEEESVEGGEEGQEKDGEISALQTPSSVEEEDNQKEIGEPRLETKEELDEFTKLEPIEDEQTEIPDWMQNGATEQNASNEDLEDVVEELKEENVETLKAKNNKNLKKKEEKEAKGGSKKSGSGKEGKKTETKSVQKKVVPQKEEAQQAESEPNVELWDDGMAVPDWLKTDDEK